MDDRKLFQGDHHVIVLFNKHAV